MNIIESISIVENISMTIVQSVSLELVTIVSEYPVNITLKL